MPSAQPGHYTLQPDSPKDSWVPLNTWASSEGKMKVVQPLSSLINRLAGMRIHQQPWRRLCRTFLPGYPYWRKQLRLKAGRSADAKLNKGGEINERRVNGAWSYLYIPYEINKYAK